MWYSQVRPILSTVTCLNYWIFTYSSRLLTVIRRHFNQLISKTKLLLMMYAFDTTSCKKSLPCCSPADLFLYLGSLQLPSSSSLGSLSSSSAATIPSSASVPSSRRGFLFFCSSTSFSSSQSCCAEADAAASGCRSCSVARL